MGTDKQKIEAVLSKLDKESLSVELIAAETDPPVRSDEYQAGLKSIATALQSTGAKVSFQMFFQDAIGASSFLLGGFTIENLKSGAVILGPFIGAWLNARYGRKVRLKVGDIEAEARTVAEVEALLKKADELRPRITDKL